MNDIFDKTQEREEIMWDNWRKQQESAQQFANAMNAARCCVDCGALIPPARIKAMPHCVRCVSCQHEYEESQK
uniref:Zinc finger protein n=1 Tax=Myoviridae sp. cttp71 TaxID=2825195 RepID=A0A8S5U3V8_9CAUD|nr:MAG TPA: zinc finger protein [Myoviridae sp. cttp71]